MLISLPKVTRRFIPRASFLPAALRGHKLYSSLDLFDVGTSNDLHINRHTSLSGNFFPLGYITQNEMMIMLIFFFLGKREFFLVVSLAFFNPCNVILIPHKYIQLLKSSFINNTLILSHCVLRPASGFVLAYNSLQG